MSGPSDPVAVVGLGKMGQAVAERLLDAGRPVTVWNRSSAPAVALGERGAVVAATLAQVWKHSDVILTFLADDQAVTDICLGPGGLFEDAPPGACLVEMSTISVRTSTSIAKEAAAAGVGYLRAPVSGNPVAVRAGQAGIIVSGDPALTDEARRLLDAIAAKVFHVGTGEEARVLKLALNVMVAGTMELLGEAIALCEAHNLERDVVLSAIAGSAVASPLVGYKTGPLLDRDHRATFSVTGMVKDLRLALAAAGEMRLPTAELVGRQLERAREAGWGDLDFSALLLVLQHDAGHTPDVAPLQDVSDAPPRCDAAASQRGRPRTAACRTPRTGRGG